MNEVRTQDVQREIHKESTTIKSIFLKKFKTVLTTNELLRGLSSIQPGFKIQSEYT